MACNRYDRDANFEDTSDASMYEDYLHFPEISNYYGTLTIRAREGVYEWGLGDWDEMFWSTIPESLYLELKKYGESKL